MLARVRKPRDEVSDDPVWAGNPAPNGPDMFRRWNACLAVLIAIEPKKQAASSVREYEARGGALQRLAAVLNRAGERSKRKF